MDQKDIHNFKQQEVEGYHSRYGIIGKDVWGYCELQNLF